MKYPFNLQAKLSQDGYQINVPDLPGCSAECVDVDEGFDKAKIAIEEHLSILAEYGEQIPHASSLQNLSMNQVNVIWGVIDVDISLYLGKSHKINVTLPELLIKQIDDRVSKTENYKSRSGFIAQACLNELNL